MSVPVEVERLHEESARYGGSAYVLTVGDDGRPHAVLTAIGWAGEYLAASVGKRTSANVSERPLVTLLWPPYEAGGYSLIVDGTADVAAGALRVKPTKAVLHRSATPGFEPAVGACGSDCVPILRT